MRLIPTQSLQILFTFLICCYTLNSSAQAPSNNDCTGAVTIDNLFNPSGGTLSSGLFDNTNATSTANDPTTGFACFVEDNYSMAPEVENSLWFTFTGDGNIYFIETNSCNSTNYINNGDTQMAIYSGDCNSLTPVACNEDGPNATNGDFKAGITLQTVQGVTYNILIDGFNGGNGVASGEFCIEVTPIAQTTCNDIDAGTASAIEQIICFGDITQFDLENTVIPTEEGDITGFRWVISTGDISGSTNPAGETGYLGAFGESPTVYTPTFANDGTQLPPNSFYYFTPVVYAGATDTVGDRGLGSLDFSTGCISTGNSVIVALIGNNGPINATTYNRPVTETNPPNGEAGIAQISGGSGFYGYSWNTGSTNDTITGLAPGTYTVTITDLGGCVDSVVVNVEVTDNVIGCDAISVGEVTEFDDILCFGDTTDFTWGVDPVIPNALGGSTGVRWIISSTDLSNSSNPGGDPSYIGAFGESPTPYTPRFVNSGTVLLPNNDYYFTPVVYAGAADTVGNGFFESLDFSNGCLAVGVSQRVFFSDDNGAITADTYVQAATEETPFNGEAGVTVTNGGSLSYNFNWSNGETSDTIRSLTPGDYTVTISDQGGCADDLVITLTVLDSITSTSTFTPEFANALKIYPNPAQDWVQIDFDFNKSTDIEIRLNTLTGQMIQLYNLPNTSKGNHRLEFEDLPSGAYFLQIRNSENLYTSKLIIE